MVNAIDQFKERQPMRTIFDMMNDPATGNSIAEMARQYGIAQEQAQAGMAALMPAFAEGMRRAASNPADFLKLMQSYGAMMQAGANTAAAQSSLEQGNAILGQLFGSKDLSRAVAAHAAQATGLSTAILKSMLPAMAPKIIEMLFGQMMGGTGSQAGANPFGKILEQMMGGSANQNRGGQNPWGKILEGMMGQAGSPAGGANPWGKALEDMLGGGQSGSRSGTGAGDNPLGKMFEEMLGGAAAGSRGSSGRTAKPSGDPGSSDKPARGPLEEMIGNMFDTGRTMQRDHQKNIESIFDEFLGGMKKG
jgi:hypothetical protein